VDDYDPDEAQLAAHALAAAKRAANKGADGAAAAALAAAQARFDRATAALQEALDQIVIEKEHGQQ
jgi:hypothetical protein